jgi:hypothetical protein
MKRAHHPLLRAFAILALLLVTQVSYAGGVCQPLAGWKTLAHTAVTQEAGSPPSAEVDCRAHSACREAVSELPACTASRLEPSLSAVATTSALELGIFGASAGPQWTLAIRMASGPPLPKLAATSHPPLRTLFCRYLV